MAAAGAFITASDTSDDITEGSTNLFFTGAEQTKLSGIETGADVTDAANVAAAGAFITGSDTSDDITEGSTNLFLTSAEQTKLSGIESGAEVNTVDSVNGNTGAVSLDADDIDDTSTTNKFTTSGDISKLSGIEAGADVNTINSDPTGVTGADATTNIMSLTTAEYTAATKGAATIYLITDAS